MVGKRGKSKNSTSTAILPPKHVNVRQLVRQLVHAEKYTATGQTIYEENNNIQSSGFSNQTCGMAAY